MFKYKSVQDYRNIIYILDSNNFTVDTVTFQGLLYEIKAYKERIMSVTSTKKSKQSFSEDMYSFILLCILLDIDQNAQPLRTSTRIQDVSIG